ncbi:MAG: hypothetical protein ACE365_07050 [Gammaproteobacteria bacterium]
MNNNNLKTFFIELAAVTTVSAIASYCSGKILYGDDALDEATAISVTTALSFAIYSCLMWKGFSKNNTQGVHNNPYESIESDIDSDSSSDRDDDSITLHLNNSRTSSKIHSTNSQTYKSYCLTTIEDPSYNNITVLLSKTIAELFCLPFLGAYLGLMLGIPAAAVGELIFSWDDFRSKLTETMLISGMSGYMLIGIGYLGFTISTFASALSEKNNIHKYERLAAREHGDVELHDLASDHKENHQEEAGLLDTLSSETHNVIENGALIPCFQSIFECNVNFFNKILGRDNDNTNENGFQRMAYGNSFNDSIEL